MRRFFIIFTLMGFSLLSFGCDKKNKSEEAINSSTYTDTSSTENTQIKLSKEYLLGRWKSTETDWPIEVNIYENSDTNQLQIDISNNNEEGIETYTTQNGYSSFFNADKSISYNFSIYENQLIMYMNSIQEYDSEQKPEDIPANAIRPWILEKVEYSNISSTFSQNELTTNSCNTETTFDEKGNEMNTCRGFVD